MKKSLILCLIIILLLTSGCAKDTNYYHKKAIKENDPYICEGIGREGWGDWERVEFCFSKFAAAKQDLKLCDELIRENRYSIKAYCYKEVAIAKEDIGICHEIPYFGLSSKIDCYDHFDFPKDQMCDSIEQEQLKDNCIEYVERRYRVTV